MPPFLIPVIMYIGHKVFGALEPSLASGIVGELSQLSGKTGVLGAISKIFTNALGNVSQEQQDKFQLELQKTIGDIDLDKISMTGNLEIDGIEAKSEGFFQSGARPFLFWGLSIIVILHCMIVEFINILHVLHVEVSQIASLDVVTATLIGTLLGAHIVTRSVDKKTNK